MSQQLFIVSGPSGAGKSSLCTAMLAACSNLRLSISCTTRSPRPGETNGIEYHFLNKETFEMQKDQGAFLEFALVHGNYYGTRQSDVQHLLSMGKNVLLEIDWQGAEQVATQVPASKRIFILPPSIDALRQRLIQRGQDNLAVIETRVLAAQVEIDHAHDAQFQIVNDDFNKALQELIAICGCDESA